MYPFIFNLFPAKVYGGLLLLRRLLKRLKQSVEHQQALA
jgi:hypothetical protein